jgi:hypothetical protein
MVPQEDWHPVDVQMDSFFECCRSGSRPKADVRVGLANSAAVVEWLLKNEVDIGFVGSPVYAPALVATLLFEDEVVFASARGARLEARSLSVAAARCLVRRESPPASLESALRARPAARMPVGSGHRGDQASGDGRARDFCSPWSVSALASGALVRIPVKGIFAAHVLPGPPPRKAGGPAIRASPGA